MAYKLESIVTFGKWNGMTMQECIDSNQYAWKKIIDKNPTYYSEEIFLYLHLKLKEYGNVIRKSPQYKISQELIDTKTSPNELHNQYNKIDYKEKVSRFTYHWNHNLSKISHGNHLVFIIVNNKIKIGKTKTPETYIKDIVITKTKYKYYIIKNKASLDKIFRDINKDYLVEDRWFTLDNDLYNFIQIGLKEGFILNGKIPNYNHISIYTDGSCDFNGKEVNKGSYGYVIIDGNTNKIIEEYVGIQNNVTNNIMELNGILSALKALEKHNYKTCTLYSDSQYCINGINQWMDGWKKNKWCNSNKEDVKNKNLWIEMYDLVNNTKNISFKWIKGHQNVGNWNDYIDLKITEVNMTR